MKPSSDSRLSTSAKLDWIDAVMADHRLDARAKVIAFCIVQHVNRNTGVAFVSDTTISDKTAIPSRWVQRARNALRTAGWISWKRTGTANVYSTLAGPMTAVTDRQQTLKKAREDRRGDPPRVAHLDPPPVAVLADDDPPPLAHHDPPQMAEHDPPPVANIPLSLTPLVMTPKKSLSMTSDSAFEKFWRVFPRKVAKLKAEKVYASIIKSKRTSVDELLASAVRYAAERATEDPQFTKHPTTWLNGGCWADEPKPTNRFATPSRADSAIAGIARFLNQEPSQ
jgi:hypothetical protein